jgi:hypothetical protein
MEKAILIAQFLQTKQLLYVAVAQVLAQELGLFSVMALKFQMAPSAHQAQVQSTQIPNKIRMHSTAHLELSTMKESRAVNHPLVPRL